MKSLNFEFVSQSKNGLSCFIDDRETPVIKGKCTYYVFYGTGLVG